MHTYQPGGWEALIQRIGTCNNNTAIIIAFHASANLDDWIIQHCEKLRSQLEMLNYGFNFILALNDYDARARLLLCVRMRARDEGE